MRAIARPERYPFGMESQVRFVAYEPGHRDAIVALSLRAWAPVFETMRQELPGYVYDAFYPQGWEARQRHDVVAACEDEATSVWVALSSSDEVAGFVGLREHREDSMGEVTIIAIDPAWQRQGVATALLDFAAARARDAGLSMVMVETGGDAGHEAARKSYEKFGFERVPVARYFRPL